MSARFFNLNGVNYVMVEEGAFNDLVESQEKLSMLEAYGVDNWCGYGEAMSDYYANQEEEEEE